MTRTTKVLLVISLVCLAAGVALNSGVVDVRGITALYVILPAGAIFFGLFLLSKMLEKEAALYDEDQRRHLDLAERPEEGLSESSAKPCCQKVPLSKEAVVS